MLLHQLVYWCQSKIHFLVFKLEKNVGRVYSSDAINFRRFQCDLQFSWNSDKRQKELMQLVEHTKLWQRSARQTGSDRVLTRLIAIKIGIEHPVFPYFSIFSTRLR